MLENLKTAAKETLKAAAFALVVTGCTIDGDIKVDHNVKVTIEGVCGDVVGAVKKALDICEEECGIDN